MPIKVGAINALNLFLVKNAVEKLGREAFKLTNPSGMEDRLYTDAVPTTSNLEEGAAIFYISGADYRIYFNINDTIKYIALT